MISDDPEFEISVVKVELNFFLHMMCCCFELHYVCFICEATFGELRTSRADCGAN